MFSITKSRCAVRIRRFARLKGHMSPIFSQSAGGIVMNDRGDVLVVNQRGLSWSLPKGHIERHEDPLTTARREIWEETGVWELRLVKPLGCYERYRGARSARGFLERKRITMFLFRTNQFRLAPIDPHTPEARWVSRVEALRLLSNPHDKEFFQSVERHLAMIDSPRVSCGASWSV